MDTGSESFFSTQNTPNSVLSSEFDDKDQNDLSNKTEEVLRLQDPVETNGFTSDVLRLSKPNVDMNNCLSVALNDSLVTKMASLNINSIDEEEDTKKTRPKHLGISPPKLASALTLTTNHPLMGITSPDSVENFPDLIPEKSRNMSKIEDTFFSIDDSNVGDSNFLDLYGNSPQRNTSKNNLYFSENFTTADSQNLNDTNVACPPDVARVRARRKIIPKFTETEIVNGLTNDSVNLTPSRVLGPIVSENCNENSIMKYIEERNTRLNRHYQSTPKSDTVNAKESSVTEEIHPGVSNIFIYVN